MNQINQTGDKGFLLLGFANTENYTVCLFFAFLLIYLLTLSGNTLIMLLVRFHAFLHTPMYFFITNLSFLEMWYMSTTVPKLLSILVTNEKNVSFQWCFAQLYMFHSLGMTECALLAIMSFDRCMAICTPLRYNIIMNEWMCKYLAGSCWTYGFLSATIPLIFTVRVPFCAPLTMDHYFCDLAPLLSLACIDTSTNHMINTGVIGFATMFNFGFILVMYVNIICAVVRLKTNAGRIKAFSTCSSHITVVMLFYSTAFTVYASPQGAHSVAYDKMFALVYAMFTPLLNPLIYSLRNKEVKVAFERVIQKLTFTYCSSLRSFC
ncbi:olfactory receptor 6N2-like [Gastrophryne carolinensis]